MSDRFANDRPRQIPTDRFHGDVPITRKQAVPAVSKAVSPRPVDVSSQRPASPPVTGYIFPRPIAANPTMENHRPQSAAPAHIPAPTYRPPAPQPAVIEPRVVKPLTSPPAYEDPMSTVAAKIIGASAKQKAEKAIASSAPDHAMRYPVALLFDISGSTAEAWKGNPADIDIINATIPELLKGLRDAPRSTPLGLHKNVIDIAIYAYNTEVTQILPWTSAENLSNQVPTLVGDKGTSTGLALKRVVADIRDYQTKQRAAMTKVAAANVIHITDGSPTDMEPGDATWKDVQERLATASGNDKVGKKQAISIVHFVTPNGCDPTFLPNAINAKLGVAQGLDRLAALTGADTVKPINKGLKDLNTLVKLIQGTVVGGTVLGKDLKKAAGDTMKNLDADTTKEKPPTKDNGVP